MAEATLPHPELPMSVDAMVAEAVLVTLRADRALSTFMTSIEAYEIDELLTEGSFTAPALAVILDATREARSGSNRSATLQTVVGIGLITGGPQRPGTQRFLRARVCDQVKRALLADAGCLLWRGRRVTEALVSWQRVTGALRLPSGSHYLTRLVATFTSDIHEATREFIE